MSDVSPYVPAPGAQPDPVTPTWTEPYEASEMATAFDAVEAEAAGLETRFDRGFRTRLYPVDAGGWLSITELDDDFHAMRIGLRIADDGVITEANGRMLRRPYFTCPRALESVAGLVGANIASSGAHRQIKPRIARTEGCLHLADMLTVAFRAFRISKGHDIEPHYAGEETRKMLLTHLPMMRDTCVSFAVDQTEA